MVTVGMICLFSKPAVEHVYSKQQRTRPKRHGASLAFCHPPCSNNSMAGKRFQNLMMTLIESQNAPIDVFGSGSNVSYNSVCFQETEQFSRLQRRMPQLDPLCRDLSLTRRNHAKPRPCRRSKSRKGMEIHANTNASWSIFQQDYRF